MGTDPGLGPDPWSAQNYGRSLGIMADHFGLTRTEMITLHSALGSIGPWVDSGTMMEIVAKIIEMMGDPPKLGK